jgi:hypothetical protein
MPRKKDKRGLWMKEVKRIQQDRGCTREVAMTLYRANQNGGKELAKALPIPLVGTANLNGEEIAGAIERRIDFLTSTIKGLRGELEGYVTELSKLLDAGKPFNIETPAEAEEAVEPQHSHLRAGVR